MDGWTRGSADALDFAREMAAAGARLAIYTDISRDGMLSGPQPKMSERWSSKAVWQSLRPAASDPPMISKLFVRPELLVL